MGVSTLTAIEAIPSAADRTSGLIRGPSDPTGTAPIVADLIAESPAGLSVSALEVVDGWVHDEFCEVVAVVEYRPRDAVLLGPGTSLAAAVPAAHDTFAVVLDPFEWHSPASALIRNRPSPNSGTTVTHS